MKVVRNFPLKKFNTYRIGKRGKVAFFPESTEELVELLRQLYRDEENFLVLGAGSNILPAKEELELSFVFTTYLRRYKVDLKKNTIIADSGVSISYLSRVAERSSLSGLEFAYTMPGTVGGAIYMNSRAFGSEISFVIDWVEACDYSGNIYRFSKDELNFSYKHSLFQDRDELIILRASFRLDRDDRSTIRRKMVEYANTRISKGHFDYPSCGSVFKNDYEKNLIAGKIIDELGFKGYRVGDAMVSKKHANFIVNLGNATSYDVLSIIDVIKERVYRELGYDLELEVVLIGD